MHINISEQFAEVKKGQGDGIMAQELATVQHGETLSEHATAYAAPYNVFGAVSILASVVWDSVGHEGSDVAPSVDHCTWPLHMSTLTVVNLNSDSALCLYEPFTTEPLIYVYGYE
jgi:hypothetical protein